MGTSSSSEPLTCATWVTYDYVNEYPVRTWQAALHAGFAAEASTTEARAEQGISTESPVALAAHLAALMLAMRVGAVACTGVFDALQPQSSSPGRSSQEGR